MKQRKLAMAHSFAAFEDLFTTLVTVSMPFGASVSNQWDGGNMCRHVHLEADGAMRAHTIKICICEQAVDAYSRSDDAQRRRTDSRLAHYLAQQFKRFQEQRMEIGLRDSHDSRWIITQELLKSPITPVLTHVSAHSPEKFTPA